MQQAFRSNTGIIIKEVPIPIPSDREILVRVCNSLISTGTETSFIKSTEYKTLSEKLLNNKQNTFKVIKSIRNNGFQKTIQTISDKIKPSEDSLQITPLGYSNSGVIIGKGRLVEDFNIGDKVACAGAGFAVHAEYTTIPSNLAVRFPESISFESASFTTIGSIAIQGLRRAAITPGETVVITGLGLIGLLAVQIAKAWGYIVIGIDLNEKRISLAEKLGADICFNAFDEKIEEKIFNYSKNIGVDAVLITASTNNSEPTNQALKLCRKKGKVIVLGSVGMDLERNDFYVKELDFLISTSYGPGRYDKNYEIEGQDYPIGYVRWTENRNMQEFIRLLMEKKVRTQQLISNIFSINQAPVAYKSLIENSVENIAVLFSYEKTECNYEFTRKLTLNPQIHPKDRINVGVIGAGGFMTKNHLPNLLILKKYFFLAAIAEKEPVKAKIVGHKFKPIYITTDYQELLSDKNIDLIIIGTRHDSHAKLVIESIKAGKHVLVEKPLALNYIELNDIKSHILNAKTYLTVGFNRRYAPLAIQVKEEINKLHSPIFINYRVNAGYTSKTSWVNDPIEGGGRIIGEACHFIDFFNFIIDSEINEIKSLSIPKDGKLITNDDNLSASISYKDGSIAHLSYVTIGNDELPKEKIEIFCGKTCMVIDDFESLNMYGTGKKKTSLKTKDKGWFRELEEFGKLILGNESQTLSIDKAILATEVTFKLSKFN